MVGNKENASQFFREKRFNNYLVGEMYVCSNKLIPNSRRDDFEDNETKDEFSKAFIKEIGIPFSRDIRHLSKERAKVTNSSNADVLFSNADNIIKYGYIVPPEKVR
jgi:molecular chaperone HtpG